MAAKTSKTNTTVTEATNEADQSAVTSQEGAVANAVDGAASPSGLGGPDGDTTPIITDGTVSATDVGSTGLASDPQPEGAGLSGAELSSSPVSGASGGDDMAHVLAEVESGGTADEQPRSITIELTAGEHSDWQTVSEDFESRYPLLAKRLHAYVALRPYTAPIVRVSSRFPDFWRGGVLLNPEPQDFALKALSPVAIEAMLADPAVTVQLVEASA